MGKDVTCFGKAGRCLEFFDRGMGELYHFGIVHLDDRKQTGASGQHRLYRIFQAPILVEFGNRPFLEIKC